MGKRSNFERKERDWYATPYKAVVPLLPHLAPNTRYIEPCAGDGVLIDHFSRNGHTCSYASDIEPQAAGIVQNDVLQWGLPWVDKHLTVITNPPWDRKILHPLIKHLTNCVNDVWLLFDADWVHTLQSHELIKHCHKIVSIGRVKWIEDSKGTGKDNCCWYLFRKETVEHTEFYGRVK